MTVEERIKLNKIRRDLSLKQILNLITESKRKAFKSIKVYKDGVQVSFDSINFKQDCTFIMKIDVMALVTYLGLIKINNVDLKDDTITGTRSRIRTQFMIASPEDAKTAHMQFDYNIDEAPEAWFLNNYFSKDLVIWNIPQLIGMGTDRDAATSINSMNSLYEQRRIHGKLNWVFFNGTLKDYNEKVASSLDSNVYELRYEGTIHNNIKGGSIF